MTTDLPRREQDGAGAGAADDRAGVVSVVRMSLVRRLGKPLLLAYLTLVVVGVLAVVASVAWMRWG